MIVSLNVIWLLALFLSGSISDSSVSIVGAMVCIMVISSHHLSKNKIDFKDNPILFMPIWAIVWCFVLSLWAIDYSTNLLGCMRLIVVLLWAYIICFYRDSADRLLLSLPYISAILTILSVISKVVLNIQPAGISHIPYFSYYVIANRLSGPFQYANTFANVLLLSMVIMLSDLKSFEKSKAYAAKIVIFLINLSGFIATGSRSSMLIFIIWIVYKIISKKEYRILLSIFLTILVTTSGVGYFALGNTQTIGRLFTLIKSSTSQTVWERLLYYIDGINCFCHHPFGLGYLGYEYLQGAFQTGAYATIFVHNDYLQWLIDYGFIPAIIMLLYLAYQIFKGKQGKLKKELLILMLTGMVFDFNLQYLFMGMLFVLLLDLPETKEVKSNISIKKSRNNKGAKGITDIVPNIVYYYAIISFLIFIYVSVAFVADNVFNDCTFALKLIPQYSQSQDKRLEVMDDFNTIDQLSLRVLDKNKYNSKAWTARAVICELTGDYEGMFTAIDNALDLSGYNIELYKEFANSIDEYIATYDGEDKAVFVSQKKKIIAKLSELKERTNPIAYKLDVPNLEL